MVVLLDILGGLSLFFGLATLFAGGRESTVGAVAMISSAVFLFAAAKVISLLESILVAVKPVPPPPLPDPEQDKLDREASSFYQLPSSTKR